MQFWSSCVMAIYQYQITNKKLLSQSDMIQKYDITLSYGPHTTTLNNILSHATDKRGDPTLLKKTITVRHISSQGGRQDIFDILSHYIELISFSGLAHQEQPPLQRCHFCLLRE